MSQRRMFSSEIVCGEEFLGMPVSCQALYFHLGMNADDDGFIQPRITMRMIGSSEDDLKVLLGKRFLLDFETGVVVIKHWLIHNMIRADRYKPTRFIEEKNGIFIKDNKAYTDRQPNGNQPAPQVRLGKDSIEAVAIAPAPSYEKEEDRPKSPKKEKFPNARKTFMLFTDMDKSWGINTTELRSAELLWEKGEESVKKAIEYCIRHLNEESFPIPRITPYLLITNWKRISDYAKRN